MPNKCKEEKCELNSSFNFSDKVAIYCSKHKKGGMINVYHKLCIEKDCKKRASYNLINEKPLYCVDHKKENMIDLLRKHCKEEKCYTEPQFNLPDKKGGLYCGKHKKENMVNVVDKRICKEKDCKTQASCNYINKTPEYCSEHKKENMFNVKTKRCREENCAIFPSYNLETEITALYCKEHKKENMIDIKSKRCLEKNCNIGPTYNYINLLPIYCNKHKKDNMINVKNKNKCKNDCDTILTNEKYKGYCLRCFIFKFPNEKISKNYKIKEIHMTDFIKEKFKEQVMIFDKQTGGCSKRRPDVYIDKFTHVIIVECDENQHRDTSCENKRTMELFQDFCNRPIVFIRFNPDSYINEGKKKLSSFKTHKLSGVPMIRDKKEWSNRLICLKICIEKWLNNIPEKEITNEYLFYDD